MRGDNCETGFKRPRGISAQFEGKTKKRKKNEGTLSSRKGGGKGKVGRELF